MEDIAHRSTGDLSVGSEHVKLPFESVKNILNTSGLLQLMAAAVQQIKVRCNFKLPSGHIQVNGEINFNNYLI